jgi:hypothetical protein
MSSATPVGNVCSVCGQPQASMSEPCPACGATPEWAELADAHEFARRRFADWAQTGRLPAELLTKIEAYYARRRGELQHAVRSGGGPFTGTALYSSLQCFRCLEFMDGPEEYCTECGVKLSGPGMRSLRFWLFLGSELQHLGATGDVPLVWAHQLENEVRERVAALRRRLDRDLEVPTARLVEPERPRRPKPNRKPKEPARPLMEILLDPHSIQLLLAAGGGLLVLGLVIWLSSLGLFDNPGVVAVCLGAGNAALLGVGVAALKYTRYLTAGRSLTLLACMVMPLNLWFYHTHNLITLDGHLWVAALVCCMVYTASAILLRDPLLVYVLCGGVALTGLLFLADIGRFGEIFAPALLLVILALSALHAEMAFPPGSGDFSRERFGRAFFWSAQALLAAGLGLLLGGQLVAWLHGPIFRFWGFDAPVVSQREYLPWTIVLTLAGTYAYVYSDVIVRHKGVYVYFAAVTLLWSEVQFLLWLNLANAEPIIVITLSLTALLVNALQHFLPRDDRVSRALPPLGLILAFLPVLLGVLLHFRATFHLAREAWGFEITGMHVAALVLTALVCRLSAFWTRKTHPEVSTAYFFATGVATLVAAAGIAWRIGLEPWERQAPVLMLVPIAYIVSAWLYREHSPSKPLVWVGQAATAFMIVCSIGVSLDITPRAVQPVVGRELNLLVALFAFEAAIFYALAAFVGRQAWNVHLGTAMLCGALWQLLTYWNAPEPIFPLTFAGAGVALLIAYRFAVLDRVQLSRHAEAAFQSANGLMSLGFLAGVMLSLSRLLVDQQQLQLLAADGEWKAPLVTLATVLGLLTALSFLACLIVAHAGWRRWYVVLAIIETILLMLTIHRLVEFDPWRQVELLCIALGILFLILGHVGWAKEDEMQSEWVSFALFFGSLLVVAPLTIASLIYRFGAEISPFNELGLVLGSVLLIGSGILCRIKATTVLGCIAMGIYLLMVLVYMHRFLKEQVIVGIYLTLGGGLLFGVGLVLSVFRDRLLALPDKIKRREGLFRIMTWR